LSNQRNVGELDPICIGRPVGDNREYNEATAVWAQRDNRSPCREYRSLWGCARRSRQAPSAWRTRPDFPIRSASRRSRKMAVAHVFTGSPHYLWSP